MTDKGVTGDGSLRASEQSAAPFSFAAMVDLERCCAFLTFRIVVAAGPPICLEITGRPTRGWSSRIPSGRRPAVAPKQVRH